MSISLQPLNQNLAQYAKFQLHFERLPYMNFFCKTVSLPGLSLTPYPQTTNFIELHVPGNKLQYDELSIKFIVDEDYKSWLDVHDWIRGMTFPTDFDEYNNLQYQQRNQPATKPPQYSDASLTIYTNKNNANMRINFVDCFPISVSSIEFDVEQTADKIITASASFKFAYFNIERV